MRDRFRKSQKPRRHGRVPGIRAILTVLVAALLLPGVAGTALLLQTVYQRNAEAIIASSLQASRALGLAVDNRLEQVLTLAQVLAASKTLARGDLSAFYDEARSAMGLPNIAFNAIVVDREGQQLLNTIVPLGTALPKVADLDAVRRVFATRAPVVGNVVMGSTLKRPVVGIYVPVGSGSERSVGVGVLPPEMEDLLALQRLPATWVAVVIDRSGRLVARSHAPERYVGRSASPEILSVLSRSDHGTVRARLLDGTDAVAVYSRSTSTGWTVVIGIPVTEFEATLKASVVWLSAGALGLVLLGLLVARIAGRRIILANEALVRAAAALGSGAAVAGPQPAVRESAAVHQALQNASDQLAERDARLRAKVAEVTRLNEALETHQRHLEAVVAERTGQLESALHAAEAASRTKSAFLANMSHEIRTPLNAVIGLAHLLGRDLHEGRHRDRVAKIETAGQHLLGILNDVLDLSKIEAGRMQLQQRRFEPDRLLQDVAAIAVTLAHAKGLEVRADARGTPPLLIGDEPKIRQALLNYVGNAIKFTERGGVTLRAAVVEENAARVLVRFEVSDTGAGIERSRLHRLFQPFEQAIDSSTPQAGGTGLGLAITRELAALMGGAAGADSTPGRGSTFWFTAWLERDVTDAEAEPTVLDAGPAEQPNRRHVLIVNVEPVGQELLMALLEGAGIQASAARDGGRAQFLLRAGGIDGVVLGTRLAEADVDPFEWLRSLRQDPALASLPVIVAVGTRGASIESMAVAAGASDIIVMPPEQNAWRAVVARWLAVRQ